MEEIRSKSYADGRTQMEGYGTLPGPTGLQDLRCYSASYASSSQTQPHMDPNPKKVKSSNGSSRSKSWSLTDPELQRKTRVASYKAYTVEGKVKGSLRKSFRWIKDTCNLVVHGWR
ncbi:Calsenilin like [Actinidia chinensis var. chinensis]|uniref:Calsenilin like n=1 Tax=Actinidia chinensis var. chinensis TaxID=1590841 RepID=A0A2R6R465_ACTCC|nr:Calsenilin like [Actinidia chinensis var. chinensis]